MVILVYVWRGSYKSHHMGYYTPPNFSLKQSIQSKVTEGEHNTRTYPNTTTTTELCRVANHILVDFAFFSTYFTCACPKKVLNEFWYTSISSSGDIEWNGVVGSLRDEDSANQHTTVVFSWATYFVCYKNLVLYLFLTWSQYLFCPFSISEKAAQLC
jgi:hypothetical protein